MRLEEPRTVQVLVAPDRERPLHYEVRVLSTSSEGASEAAETWVLHAEGKVSLAPQERQEVVPLEEIQKRCSQPLDCAAVYQRYEALGISYGSSFRVLHALAVGEGECVGEVSLPCELESESLAYVVHPVLLDGCFQAIGGLLSRGTGPERTYLPVGMGAVVVHGRAGLRLYSHVRAVGGGGSEPERVDVRVYNGDGQLVLSVQGLELRAVSRERLVGEGREVGQWLYEVQWPEQLQWSGPGLAQGLPSAGSLTQTLSEPAWESSAEGSEPFAQWYERLEQVSVGYIVQAFERWALRGRRWAGGSGLRWGRSWACRRGMVVCWPGCWRSWASRVWFGRWDRTSGRWWGVRRV